LILRVLQGAGIAVDDRLGRVVMSFRGSTKVHQHRRSNFQGFLMEPIGTAFPELKAHFSDLMRMTLEPVANLERTWRGSMQVRAWSSLI